jgi:hypothetical protein
MEEGDWGKETEGIEGVGVGVAEKSERGEVGEVGGRGLRRGGGW